VYSIESGLIINPKRSFFTALDPQLSTEEVLPSFVIRHRIPELPLVRPGFA
jgi:hypothetical protein